MVVFGVDWLGLVIGLKILVDWVVVEVSFVVVDVVVVDCVVVVVDCVVEEFESIVGVVGEIDVAKGVVGVIVLIVDAVNGVDNDSNVVAVISDNVRLVFVIGRLFWVIFVDSVDVVVIVGKNLDAGISSVTLFVVFVTIGCVISVFWVVRSGSVNDCSSFK